MSKDDDPLPGAFANPRLAKALDVDGARAPAPTEEELAILPPIPEPLTDESVVRWIRSVIPMMSPRSEYRQRLIRVLDRYEFVKHKAVGEQS